MDHAQQEFEAQLYIITHDLKTYSRAMRVIPDWIEEDMTDSGSAIPPVVGEHIEMLQKYARGMDAMLDSLTDLSRVGRLADAPTTIALRPAVERIWQTLPQRQNYTLDVDHLNGATRAPVNDLDRLLTALLSNAVVHRGDPAGRVAVRSHRQGDRIALCVLDDGPGVDPEVHEQVFTPLYTLRPKDETGFSGMGLAIARKVVGTLGGQIRFATPPDDWSCCIECDLPAATQV
ncbi:sensor histidine kinase [Sagittula sp. SSi028]|uniref:sensor histidine kinase n=1 Tax=Sagittula sp. SSi028 TaxID=3400636 RepID=UPI003AFA0060